MREIVVNTGPIIALVAATQSIEWLPTLYDRILIPYEVLLEIKAGGIGNPETLALHGVKDLVTIGQQKACLPPALLRELDLGEASVIHTAIHHGISTVAIDEKAGRRIARLNGLKVTGSLGILIKAKKHGLIDHLSDCISRIQFQGIWISETLVQQALAEVGEY
jgi:predicted nucleic acid-binding protein